MIARLNLARCKRKLKPANTNGSSVIAGRNIPMKESLGIEASLLFHPEGHFHETGIEQELSNTKYHEWSDPLGGLSRLM
jgi:hypothetical protein